MKVLFNWKSDMTPEQVGSVIGSWCGSMLVVVCEVTFAYLCWNYFIHQQLNMPVSTFGQVAAVILVRNIIFSPIAIALKSLGKSKKGN